MSGDDVFQAVGGDLVVHERRLLAGNLDAFDNGSGSDGKWVEIRYPVGDVGIMMPLRDGVDVSSPV